MYIHFITNLIGLETLLYYTILLRSIHFYHTVDPHLGYVLSRFFLQLTCQMEGFLRVKCYLVVGHQRIRWWFAYTNQKWHLEEYSEVGAFLLREERRREKWEILVEVEVRFEMCLLEIFWEGSLTWGRSKPNGGGEVIELLREYSFS